MGFPATIPDLPVFTKVLQIDPSMVERGVALETLMSFLTASGLQLQDIYDVVIPARTLKHRRAGSQTLSEDESDRFARLVRVFDHAVQVFGELGSARHWLATPKYRFSDRTPLQMLRTDTNARLVEEMLGQIDHGFFA